ncbi:MAG: hypothetical protein BV459_01975 [Thermoplasmata archaeon M11B2D]|nr:MAG: hypothetical protein BV459_01975 [Thermoplasmata archaeon M11B2D]
MAVVLEKLTLQSAGAYKETENTFSFMAKSISENEICESMMDILISQAPNQPFIFRHRHPASTDKKVIPIFGRIKQATKERIKIGDTTVSKNEDGTKLFMVSEFEVPLKSPLGHELPHNKVFAEWIKESYDSGNPIGISLAFLKYLETKDGKKQAYWVDLYEASGTHVPACVDCVHIEGGEAVMSVNEADPANDGKKKVEQEKYKELETQLEAMTLEKQKLEGEIKELEKGNETLKKSLEEKDGATKLLMEQVTKLAAGVSALEEKLEYAETMKPLVDKIIKLEGRPELENFYRTQTKEYLELQMKKLEGPVDANVDNSDIATRILNGMKKELESKKEEPAKEQLEKNIDPSLLPLMQEFWKNGGR